MTARLKSFLRISLSIVFALLFLYLAFRGSDFGKLITSLNGANYFWALLLVPCLLVSHLIRAWRWKYLLGPIKNDLKFRNLFSSLMVGYMVNNVLPRVGEIVRPYSIGRLERISMSAALGTVLVERIIDILSLLVILVILLFYQSSLVEVFPWLQTGGIVLAVVTVCVFLFFAFLLAKREQVFRWLRKVTGRLRLPLMSKLENVLRSFLDGFLIIREPRRYAMIAFLSILIWLGYALMLYFPFYAFRMTELYQVDFLAAVVTVAISAIAFIIPAPGGTGSYHWLARETLVNVFGVDVEVALSYATVTHLLGIISVTIVGLYYFARDHLRLSEAIHPAEGEKPETESLSEGKTL